MSDLAELAAIVNAEHEQMLGYGRAMIDHAVRCGEALLQARELVPYGEWLPWMEANIQVTVWTAHRYMRLASHKDVLAEHDVVYIEDAMRILADFPRLGYGPAKHSAEDLRAMADCYHEHGMAATMRAFGVAKSTVWRYTSDRSPHKLTDEQPVRPSEVTDEAVERLAQWLVERFGSDEYPERVTPDVREDAEAALTFAYTAPDQSDLPRDEKVKLALTLYAEGRTLAQIAARFGVATNTVGRWCEPDQDTRHRASSVDWKNQHREANRERDRQRARELAAGGIGNAAVPDDDRSVSPFDRLMWEQEAAT